MKILHIGDLHIGCTLENFRRNREIGGVFRHLAAFVRENGVEATLLAGDVFDSGSPSGESQEMYYGFLLDLQRAGCRQVIVIAGNHDNPNLLDAPGGLLRQMNIHVVGGVDPDDPAREVVPLGEAENPAGYVCAVPYLRPRDVRNFSPEGESGERRSEAIRQGIEAHYRKVFAVADALRGGRDLPVIGMGHLYASGSSFGSGEPQNPAGNLDAVELSRCAEGFDYMALGHLHRPQTVAGREHWRYAGSILPMEVREEPFPPQVVLLDTADLKHPRIFPIPPECFHKMCVVKGDMEELRSRLEALGAEGVPVWVKPVYTGSEVLPNWSIDLRQAFRDTPVRIVAPEIRREAAPKGTAAGGEEPRSSSLAELTPEEVFLAHLEKTGEVTDPEQRELFLSLFRQAERQACDPAVRTEPAGRTENAGVMRFRRLFIKNVNSLYGENLIDFDAPEFKDGIFLISGNTGAGKSSILDAVCLALYGCTPRVKTISNTRDSVMSEGADEMIAELTFTLGRDEYRAGFRHERTGGRARIPFRTPKHQLFRNGREIPAMPRQGILPEIQKLIGMDETQFSRCVLLAQGGFDAFLKAKPGERSGILKSITGTEIYTKIGGRINQNFLEVKNEYALASRALEGIHFLSDGESVEARKRRDEAAVELAGIERRLNEAEIREALFQTLEQGRERVREAADRAAAAVKAHEAAEPERREYRNAVRAENCQAPYREFQERKKRLDTLKKEEDDLRKCRTKLEAEDAAAHREHLQREAVLKEMLRRRADEAELFQEVRLLDARIAGQRNLMNRADEELENARKRRALAETAWRQAEEKWRACRRKSAAASEYLAAHPNDAALAGRAEAWELRRLRLAADEAANAAEQRALDDCAAACRKDGAALGALRREHWRTETLLRERSEAVAAGRRMLSGLLDGKTFEEIQTAWAAAGKLSEFFKDAAQRRAYLTKNRPCPLCGSLSHPYCEGTPVPDDREFDETAAALKARLDAIAACRDRIGELEREKGELEVRAAGETARIEALTGSLRAAASQLKTRRRDREEACRRTEEAAAQLTDEFRQALRTEWRDRAALPPELASRIKAFAEAEKIMESLAGEQKAYETASGTFSAVSVQNEILVKEKENAAAAAAETLEQLTRERAERFGAKEVEEEEKRRREALEACREARDLAAAAAVRAEEALQHNRNEQEKIQIRRTGLQPELAAAEKTLAESFREFGFSSEAEFLFLSREPRRMRELNAALTELEERVKTAQAALAERRKNLDEQAARLPEGMDRARNQEEILSLRTARQETQGRLTQAELLLRNDQEARRHHEAAEETLHRLQTEFNRWKFLDDHFGSTAAADRFGRIAQGYTFRELLHFANANRLPSLRRHFTLIGDRDDPLELNVIDHYRGDLVRTSRNLSGGESFEVSLALALGLAEMSAVSQNASLGNVLLDEGFGTLDDQSLESALELLMQLKNSGGKLVGIISHVPKLKERIAAQIEVSSSAGMGSLSGAGVAPHRAALEAWRRNHPEDSSGRRRAAPSK